MSNVPSSLSSAFSQPTSSPNGSSNNSNQSPVGSPPLILAFLAIGIFSAAMIAVFGWRRVQFGRDPHLWGLVDGAGSHGRRGGGMELAETDGQAGGTRFGERPVLWEAWTDHANKVERGDYGCWDSTMPLAVLSTSSLTTSGDSTCHISPTEGGRSRPPEPPPVFPLQQATRPSRRRPRFTEVTPLSFFRRHPLPNTTPTSRMNTAQEQRGENAKKEDRDVNIVMVIEMPSPTKSRYRGQGQSLDHDRNLNRDRYSTPSNYSETLVDNTGRMRRELDVNPNSGQLQYCLGVHTCSWPTSPTLPPTNSNGPERIPQSQQEKGLG
ncbi:hypothetical protein NP233_g12504 [Leucocoprinus birnbaumii]|uniref:Uncharacterized protein n=1 Tax=Leucocoprinus birnbaumii TaxID=56174 RepID=A0AAD5VEE3_9AGAR|nr:hypothetical protein NP233_g12504 [Leucocoprinus birnbaumii]